MGERRRDRKQRKLTRQQTAMLYHTQNQQMMQQNIQHQQMMQAIQAPASGPPPPPGQTPSGWYPDPARKFPQRYWSGTAWTEHVRMPDGSQAIDPPPSSDGPSSN